MKEFNLIPLKYSYSLNVSKGIANNKYWFAEYLTLETKKRAKKIIAELAEKDIVAFTPDLGKFKQTLRIGDLMTFSDHVAVLMNFEIYISEKDRYKHFFINGTTDEAIDMACQEALKVVREQIYPKTLVGAIGETSAAIRRLCEVIG